MKKINVIDLDGTLIPYDSFKKYIFLLIRKCKPFTALRIYHLILLRVLRLLSNSDFKKAVIRSCREATDYNEALKSFSKQLFGDVRKDILAKIDIHQDGDTINILCSASPIDYCILLAEMLGFECLASSFDEKGNFIHCYAEQKLTLLQQNYRSDCFIYNYSISDSRSDLPVLMAFNYYTLLKDNIQGADTGKEIDN